MKTRTAVIIVVIISAALALMGFALSGRIEPPYVTHWDAQGNPNGFGSAFVAFYLMPLMILGISLLLLSIQKIDPLGKNYMSFRPTLNTFVVLMAAFMAYVQIMTLVWNLGYQFDFTRMMIPAMGLLFIFLGSMLGKVRQNWFIGIRTPWTISNEEVWNKTHALGGKLFMIAGAISLLGIFFPILSIFFLMVPLFAVTIITIVYSYQEYKRVTGRHDPVQS